jgi:hypothetical protein
LKRIATVASEPIRLVRRRLLLVYQPSL